MLPPTGVPISIDLPTSNVQLDQLSTSVLDGVQKLVSALDDRASWLLNSNHLNAALNDANAMIAIAPWSPAGYLHVGIIHVIEKRHESAVGIYDEGLRHVPTNHPRYRELVRARALAASHINRSIDFVSKLPLDVVVCNIIPRLIGGETAIMIGDENQYLNVCRTWRKRIAMAEDLSFIVGPKSLTPRGIHQLLDMAPGIRALAVGVDSLHDTVTKLTQDFGFHSLKKLSIYGVRFTQLTNETLLALLSLNRALTYLNIQSTMFRGWQHRLCDIMNACPNLMAISFSSYGLDMTGAAMEYPNIIKLHIDSFMDKDTLSSILRRFPNLKCLRLGHVLYSGVLTDIQQHCPLLQQLFVSAQYGGYADTATIVDGHEKGLRVLHLSGGERRQLAVQGRNMDWKRRQVFSENDVVRFIMQHSETLETITIDCEYGLAAPSTLLKRAATQQVTFKRLREIRYPFNSHKGLVSFLLWIIRHAPHLESVETVYGTLQAPVMQELLGPTHQQHLKKIGLLVDGSDQANEEQQFIQHHLQLDQQSNLKEIALKLDLHDVSSNSWILLIPQLAHLTHLEIRCDKWHMMNHVVSPFITEIVASQCLALERFTLSSPTLSIAYDHISGISSHTNLKVLTLNATNLDGDARSFVRCCQHIQSLHLILDTFDWDDINTLKTGTFKLLYTQRSGSYTHSILKKIHQ